MATHNATSIAQVQNFMSSAAPGDVITLAPGTYTGPITKSNVTKAEPRVTIRALNTGNRPRLVGSNAGFEWNNINGFNVDGLILDGTTRNGRVFDCSRVTFTNCEFGSSGQGMDIRRPTTVALEFCEFFGWEVNNLSCQWGANGYIVRNCHFHDPVIGTEPHRDSCQFAIQAANSMPRCENVTIEDNLFDIAGAIQGPFCNHPAGGTANVFVNFTIRRNWIIGGHDNGICFFKASSGIDVNHNRMQLNAEHVHTRCRIRIGSQSVTGSITNNVLQDSIDSGAGDNTTKSGNVVSQTATPPGWSGFDVANGIYGPYNQGGGVDPTPATLTTTPGDAHINGVYDAGVIGGTQYYSGEIDIPSTSDAYGATGAGDIELQWKDASTAFQSCTVSPTQPSGGTPDRRYRMAGSGTSFARTYNQTHSGIALRWRPAGNSVWSAQSTFTLSYTTPTQQVVLPVVTSVTPQSLTYSVGQQMACDFTYTLGSGTLVQRFVEVYRNGSLYSTRTPSVDTALQTLTEAGTYFFRVRIDTTDGQSTPVNSANINVTDVPVAPSISSVTLDKSSYVTGEVATATVLFSTGNGTGITGSVDFQIGGVTQATSSASIAGSTAIATWTISSTGNLTAEATITSSAGSSPMVESSISTVGASAPTAPDIWVFTAVQADPVLANRFTTKVRFPLTSNVNVGTLTAVQWAFTSAPSTWRNTVADGTDSNGRTTWRLQPSATPGDASHTVGFSEQSAPITIRISTSGGTSAASPQANTFTGPAQPPTDPGNLDPFDADDVSIINVVAAPGIPDKFTAEMAISLTSDIDEGDVTLVEWLSPGGAWLETEISGTDAGLTLRRLKPSAPGLEEHVVGYDETMSGIRFRYQTAEDFSQTGLGTYSFTGPDLPSQPTDLDGFNILVGGNRLITAKSSRPAPIDADATLAEIREDEDDAEVFVVAVFCPPLPQGATHYELSYNGMRYIATDPNQLTFEILYVSGVNKLTLVARDDFGVGSIALPLFLA